MTHLGFYSQSNIDFHARPGRRIGKENTEFDGAVKARCIPTGRSSYERSLNVMAKEAVRSQLHGNNVSQGKYCWIYCSYNLLNI